MKLFQLKCSLKDIEPKIWRKFLVKDTITFHKLHMIIQEVMGWEDYHLYEFDIDGIQIGIIDDDALNANPELQDSKKIKIFKFINEKKQKFNYVYDFGDSWEHEIVVEDIKASKDVEKVPLCIDGKRACPPEDCGGVGGYYNCIEVLTKDQLDKDEKELKKWIGDWNPELFDKEKVNKRLIKYNG